MKNQAGVKSERGIALIVVLLLMAVLSGLATGFAMTGNVEVQMGTNEVYFAGARAAAEAGLNRAIVEIVANTDTEFLRGHDGDIAATADNGKLTWLLNNVAGPYALDAAGRYTYDIEILDDDDDALYETPLSDDQVTLMGESPKDPTVNLNDRLILRAIGRGPNGTIVRIARVLETVDKITTTTTTVVSNPAIVVDGDLEMNGTITIKGTTPEKWMYGSVHANGNLAKTGASGTVTGDATATGTYTAAGGFEPGGEAGGSRPAITVPDIVASQYEYLASYKLAVVGGVGQIQAKDSSGNWAACTTSACKSSGWSYSSGEWSTDKTPLQGTFYVEGNVDIGPTSGDKQLSVIATGDIRIHGNARLSPANTEKVQFVTEGDLMIDNGSDIDPPIDLDGQIMVKGQLDAGGNMEFQGRVMVKDIEGVGNLVEFNKIHGNVVFQYGGALDAIDSEVVATLPTTYINNVSVWMER